jgi:DNA polymerase III subunit beta
MFYDIVRKLPEGSQVVLDVAPATAPAHHPRRPLALHAADAAGERLPRPRRRRDDAPFALPAADLKRLIDKTQFAISTEETRYYLNGIYLHTAAGDKRRCCARSPPTATGWRRPTCRLPAGAAGMPASSCRARPWRGAAPDREPEAEVAVELSGQDPVHDRRRGADLEADRRHLPGLCAVIPPATTRS